VRAYSLLFNSSICLPAEAGKAKAWIAKAGQLPNCRLILVPWRQKKLRDNDENGFGI